MVAAAAAGALLEPAPSADKDIMDAPVPVRAVVVRSVPADNESLLLSIKSDMVVLVEYSLVNNKVLKPDSRLIYISRKDW